MTEILRIAESGQEAARQALEGCVAREGVAVFPADTVYGLACDPESEAAVERICALKGRRRGRPAAVMFFSPYAMADALLDDLGARTRLALARLLPGPVTVVVANPRRRFPLACGEDPSRLGLRLIAGPLAGLSRPVMQTSANPSGGPDPRRVKEVDPGLVDGADLVLDRGELPGTPSTVVDLGEYEGGGKWRLLREGAVARREIARALG